MTGKSPVMATEKDRKELRRPASSFDRSEADRARAILLTLEGWISSEIGAFGVREDTVRLWRSEYAKAGSEALETHVAAGPSPFKAEAALRVAEKVPAEPVADRTNWTLPRLADEIERREGVRISTSRLSVVLRKKGVFDSAARGTL